MKLRIILLSAFLTIVTPFLYGMDKSSFGSPEDFLGQSFISAGENLSESGIDEALQELTKPSFLSFYNSINYYIKTKSESYLGQAKKFLNESIDYKPLLNAPVFQALLGSSKPEIAAIDKVKIALSASYFRKNPADLCNSIPHFLSFIDTNNQETVKDVHLILNQLAKENKDRTSEINTVKEKITQATATFSFLDTPTQKECLLLLKDICNFLPTKVFKNSSHDLTDVQLFSLLNYKSRPDYPQSIIEPIISNISAMINYISSKKNNEDSARITQLQEIKETIEKISNGTDNFELTQITKWQNKIQDITETTLNPNELLTSTLQLEELDTQRKQQKKEQEKQWQEAEEQRQRQIQEEENKSFEAFRIDPKIDILKNSETLLGYMTKHNWDEQTKIYVLQILYWQADKIWNNQSRDEKDFSTVQTIGKTLAKINASAPRIIHQKGLESYPLFTYSLNLNDLPDTLKSLYAQKSAAVEKMYSEKSSPLEKETAEKDAASLGNQIELELKKLDQTQKEKSQQLPHDAPIALKKLFDQAQKEILEIHAKNPRLRIESNYKDIKDREESLKKFDTEFERIMSDAEKAKALIRDRIPFESIQQKSLEEIKKELKEESDYTGPRPKNQKFYASEKAEEIRNKRKTIQNLKIEMSDEELNRLAEQELTLRKNIAEKAENILGTSPQEKIRKNIEGAIDRNQQEIEKLIATQINNLSEKINKNSDIATLDDIKRELEEYKTYASQNTELLKKIDQTIAHVNQLPEIVSQHIDLILREINEKITELSQETMKDTTDAELIRNNIRKVTQDIQNNPAATSVQIIEARSIYLKVTNPPGHITNSLDDIKKTIKSEVINQIKNQVEANNIDLLFNIEQYAGFPNDIALASLFKLWDFVENNGFAPGTDFTNSLVQIITKSTEPDKLLQAQEELKRLLPQIKQAYESSKIATPTVEISSGEGVLRRSDQLSEKIVDLSKEKPIVPSSLPTIDPNEALKNFVQSLTALYENENPISISIELLESPLLNMAESNIQQFKSNQSVAIEYFNQVRKDYQGLMKTMDNFKQNRLNNPIVSVEELFQAIDEKFPKNDALLANIRTKLQEKAAEINSQLPVIIRDGSTPNPAEKASTPAYTFNTAPMRYIVNSIVSAATNFWTWLTGTKTESSTPTKSLYEGFQ